MEKINLESTKNCKIINTLQAAFKLEDNEVGRGYPEAVVDEIIKISQIENFKDLNVAVIDDYNLEMTSKLTKLGAKVSLICCSKRFEKFAKNIYKEDVFEHILYYEDVGNLNMKFDLIIANPPYGKGCSLAVTILNVLKSFSRKIVYLCLENIIKDDDIRNHIFDYKLVDATCFNISVDNRLIIALLDKNTSITRTVDEMLLDTKGRTLIKAITAYNESHEIQFFDIDGNCLEKKFEKRLIDCTKKLQLGKIFDSIKETKLKTLIDESYVFMKPLFWPKGSPKNLLQSYEGFYNFQNKWLDEWNRKHACDLLVFPSKEARNNFRTWAYSGEDTFWKIGENGLCRLIRVQIKTFIGSGAGASYFRKYLPHVDWSRSWTDEEILEEIGLPKDFLKDYNNK